MEADDPLKSELDIETQEILLAASNHDLPRLQALTRAYNKEENPVNVKDSETGYTPLHSAIAACERDDDGQEDGPAQMNRDGYPNGKSHLDNVDMAWQKEAVDAVEEEAAAVLQYLLQEGAIWNDLDANDETPGCIARRLGRIKLYGMMVDAGVRAEMLLNRLEGYEALEDDNENEEREKEQGNIVEGSESVGMNPDVSNSRYLQSDLTFQGDRLLDDDANGVMMSWETDIMKKSAEALLPTPGLRVLNVGHGMGIIDDLFQAQQPVEHHIVEAHPAVLMQMERAGWMDKPGVTVHRGRWQDVLPQLMENGIMFDAIFYDTFAESYAEFREFFSEQVIGLLEQEGRWAFFNGMGADRQIAYDVYQKVVEMDLMEAGFDVEWQDINVPDLEERREWEGVQRKYWAVDNYRLPICRYY